MLSLPKRIPPLLTSRPVLLNKVLLLYFELNENFIKNLQRKFPGGPVRAQRFHCGGLSSIPGQGTKILQVVWQKKKFKNKIGIDIYTLKCEK